MEEVSRTKLPLYLLCIGALLAFVFKLILLLKRGSYLDPDEGYYILLAQNLLAGRGYTFNGLEHIHFPPFLPLLIALGSMVFSSLLHSLAFITALAGTSLGILSYFMARRAFDEWQSLACASFVLFCSQLNAFAPPMSSYLKELYRGSDVLGVFLVYLTIYFLLGFYQSKNKVAYAVAAGATNGLAYLTRQENLILFAIFGAVLFFVSFRHKWGYRPPIFFLLTFSLVASPYLLYLRSVTGIWTPSGKVGSVDYRQAMLKIVENNDWKAFDEQHYAFDKKRGEMVDVIFGFSGQQKGSHQIKGGNFFKKVGTNLSRAWLIPWTLIALPLLLLLPIGIHKTLVERDNLLLPGVFYLLLVPHSLIIVLLAYPIPRHHLFLVPLACYFGVLALWKLTAGNRKLLFFGLLIICLAIANDYNIRFTESALNDERVQRRLAAKEALANYLREHNSRIVMSKYPDIAILAKSDWQVMPGADLGTIVAFARKKNVDFIVIRAPEGEKKTLALFDLKNSSFSSGKASISKAEERPDFDVLRWQ